MYKLIENECLLTLESTQKLNFFILKFYSMLINSELKIKLFKKITLVFIKKPKVKKDGRTNKYV